MSLYREVERNCSALVDLLYTHRSFISDYDPAALPLLWAESTESDSAGESHPVREIVESIMETVASSEREFQQLPNRPVVADGIRVTWLGADCPLVASHAEAIFQAAHAVMTRHGLFPMTQTSSGWHLHHESVINEVSSDIEDSDLRELLGKACVELREAQRHTGPAVGTKPASAVGSIELETRKAGRRPNPRTTKLFEFAARMLREDPNLSNKSLADLFTDAHPGDGKVEAKDMKNARDSRRPRRKNTR